MTANSMHPQDHQGTFISRLGLALIAPKWALAVAGDRRNPGRAGSDLMRVIAMLLLGAHLRGLVVAVWLMIAVDRGLGVRTAGAVFSAALSTPMVFLSVSAMLLWIASGQARLIGRAFDLACVAVIPLMLVLLIGINITQMFAFRTVPMAGLVVLGGGFGWAGALVTLALVTARKRMSIDAVPPSEVTARGNVAGWVTLTVLALAMLLQLGWIVRNHDQLRPVSADDPAPAIALPEIGPGGVLRSPVQIVPSSKPIVIDFWATWCAPCIHAMPQLEKLRIEHPEIDVVTINLDDPEKARRMFDEKSYGLRLLFDNAGVADRYGVATLPHVVMVDRSGKVHEVRRGSHGELERLLP